MTATCTRCGLFHPTDTPCLHLSLPVSAAPDELAEGTMLAKRYKILSTIHRGGMSVVYLADDAQRQGRRVALKELRLPISASAGERQEAEAWFARESYLLSSLRSPLIPAFYSVFAEGGHSYIVQEYVAGQNLETVVSQRGPLDERLVAGWGAALCGLLEYLHGLEEPVVFRDLKPANILLRDLVPGASEDGPALAVVDFGIARPLSQGTVGTVIGTPGYAPPEQYQGLADARSDIYALGATLHRLLTGYDPEHGTQFTFPPVRNLNPRVSPELAAIVERAVRLDPAARFESAEAMGWALREGGWQASAPIWATAYTATARPLAARRGRWIGMVICVTMLAPAVLSAASSFLDCPPSTEVFCLPTVGDGQPFMGGADVSSNQSGGVQVEMRASDGMSISVCATNGGIGQQARP